MRKALIIITATLIASAMCGCFKDVVDYTFYNIAIYEQTSTDDPFTPATDVETYAFNVDTTEWRVASYDDALAHRITNKLTGEVKSDPDAFGSFNASETYQCSIRLDAPISMIIMICPQSQIYAYRNYELPENLAQVDTKLYLGLWRPSHNAAGWRVVNQYYSPPTPKNE
ncbi:MAG: hypothetical protein J6U52_07240 [Alistipes sp.]|nr:hypothetical protein [Alistipes sp.]